jgi:hypothetical protein
MKYNIELLNYSLVFGVQNDMDKANLEVTVDAPLPMNSVMDLAEELRSYLNAWFILKTGVSLPKWGVVSYEYRFEGLDRESLHLDCILYLEGKTMPSQVKIVAQFKVNLAD